MRTILKSRQKLPTYEHISRTIAYLASAAAISGTVFTYLLGLRSFAIVSLYATVPIVVASAAYFAVDRPCKPTAVLTRPLSSRRMKLSVILYFAFHTTALSLLATTHVRPYSYYALVSLTAVVIAFQILRSRLERPYVFAILFEISALMTSIAWSVTLNYHYFFGRTDVFPHDSNVDSLLDTHHVTAAFGEYQAFPLWQISTGFQHMVYDGTVETITIFYVVTGFLYGLSTIAVYALSRRFLFSERVSLLAALGMCFHPFVLLYGMYAIPRSVTAVLFLLSFLTLLVDDVRGSVLFVGLVVGIAVYHTVSLPFVFVTLGCYYAVERFLSAPQDRESASRSPLVSTWQLLSVPAVQISYWAVADPDLISRIVDLVVQSSSYGVESEDSSVTTQFIESPFHELVNYLPFGLIVLFVFFAVVQAQSVTRLSRRGKHLLLTALLLLVISFPGPVLLISVVSNVTPDNVLRFGQYTFPFIVIAFAVGVVTAVRTPSPIGGHEFKLAVVLLLVCSTAFLAVSNDFVASDNPIVERDDFYTFYLTEHEVDSFESISGHSRSGITGDYITCRYVDNPGSGQCEIIQADPVEERLHFPGDSVLVLRKDELADRPLSIYPTSEPVAEPPFSNFRESVPKESGVWNALDGQNRVYDSREVTAYTDR